jgi:hypothetical protein
MGHSHWSDAAYQTRQHQRKSTGKSAFTYDDQVRRSGVIAVHPQMNPFGKTRESRDSQAHPDSVAIGVLFDVTGSMGQVPRVLQTKLGALMRLLVQRGYLAHPQILFGAVGDAYCDRVPLQIGQFESGLEMDDDLGKIVLEGGGGGQTHESYELGFYFMARHSAIDCYEKRGRKGYLFTIGDEKPYPVVSRRQVADLVGDHLEIDIPVEQAIAELHARYEHFHIMPTETHHGRSANVQGRWRELLGERVLLLEDAGAVCETIALAIGLCEGTLPDLGDARAELVAAGYDASAAGAATTALAQFAAVRPAPPRLATGLLPGA